MIYILCLIGYIILALAFYYLFLYIDKKQHFEEYGNFDNFKDKYTKSNGFAYSSKEGNVWASIFFPFSICMLIIVGIMDFISSERAIGKAMERSIESKAQAIKLDEEQSQIISKMVSALNEGNLELEEEYHMKLRKLIYNKESQN